MADPESPSFNRKILPNNPQFVDSQYWRTPVQRVSLGFEEEDEPLPELQKFSARQELKEMTEIGVDGLAHTGVNGTVRRFQKQKVAQVQADTSSSTPTPQVQEVQAPVIIMMPLVPRTESVPIVNNLYIANHASTTVTNNNVSVVVNHIAQPTSAAVINNFNNVSVFNLIAQPMPFVPSPQSCTYITNNIIETHTHYHQPSAVQVVDTPRPSYIDLDYVSPQTVNVYPEAHPHPQSAARPVTNNFVSSNMNTAAAVPSSNHAALSSPLAILNAEKMMQESRINRLGPSPFVQSNGPARNQGNALENGGALKPQSLQSHTTLSTISPPLKDGDYPVKNSETTRAVAKIDRQAGQQKFFFRCLNVGRAIGMTAHCWATTYPSLDDPRVIEMNGKGLLIAILVFSTLDVVFSFVKAWPKRFWCFFSTKESFDAVQYFGNVWAVLADHDLLLFIVPMFLNLTLRVYSYRFSEVIGNPLALNIITNNAITFNDLTTPTYSNLVQLGLWGASIVITMIFYTAVRVRHFSVRYKSISLGLVIATKSLLLLLDMVTTSLFLYTFLVSLGPRIFGTSPTIPLMLSIMITSPLISTVCNSFINLPLLFTFNRMEKSTSPRQAFRSALQKLFSPLTAIGTVLALYYIATTGYLLYTLDLVNADTNQLGQLVDLDWSPKRIVVSLVVVNLVFNYLVGVAFSLLYYTLRMCSLCVGNIRFK